MTSDSPKHFEIELTERVGFEDLPAVVVIINPYQEIDNATSRDDYFNAFVVAVSFFEYYGYRKLRDFFKNQISDDKLERLSASEIMIFLFGLKIIDQPTYARMKDVIDMRNDLVHPKGDIAKKYRLDKNEAKSLLGKAKQVIEALLK